MKEIKVSIIIPVYNVEKYLEECLESLINQTLKDIEIICVNDGSTDNSIEILEEYAKKDERIKVLDKKHCGISVARNRGMEHATGEYMGFIDSDDWTDPTMFEKLYQNARLYDTDISMCPILLVNETSAHLNRDTNYFDLTCFSDDFDNRAFRPEETREFVFDIAVNVFNKIYRTEFLRRIHAKFPESLIFEDVSFFYDTYLKASKISLVREFLIYHRVNRSNSITATGNRKHFDTITTQNLMLECFQSIPDFEEYKTELYNKKIFRIIRRYFEVDPKLRPEFYELIKKDFLKMDLTIDELDKLRSGNKRSYINIVNSNSHLEFELTPCELSKPLKKLVISYCFPPYADVDAHVMAKHIWEQGDLVDVVQNDMSDNRNMDEQSMDLIEDIVENQVIINSRTTFGNWEHIKEFCKKGMDEIIQMVNDKGKYQEIYSRSMFPASHFLAFDYKIKFPRVLWIAEFSEPIIFNTDGKVRKSKIEDQKFLEKVEKLLSQGNYPSFRYDDVYFSSEFLPYIFADILIFNNENQKDFTVKNFPVKEIADIIASKSLIKIHPTLKEKFYHRVESKYVLNRNYVNLAYFGSFYRSRNLNDIFYALFSLEDSYRDECKIHIFTPDVESFQKSQICNPVMENLEINSDVSFLEFLNLTTKFDCLIVADVPTNGDINPYLTSKYSDYLGSGTDIWALYEEGSAISRLNVKYRSILGSVASTRELLKQIIDDKKERMI
ncbi:MAG TPA: glycosyltransferase [Methanobacterium sp.]|nr:glycosyltransferase [Methanobacterium sp.]